jgi:hypothetical protein
VNFELGDLAMVMRRSSEFFILYASATLRVDFELGDMAMVMRRSSEFLYYMPAPPYV